MRHSDQLLPFHCNSTAIFNACLPGESGIVFSHSASNVLACQPDNQGPNPDRVWIGQAYVVNNLLYLCYSN